MNVHLPLSKRHQTNGLPVADPNRIYKFENKKSMMCVGPPFIFRGTDSVSAMLAVSVYEDNSKILVPLIYKWRGLMFTEHSFVNLDNTLCLQNHWVRM